MLIPFCGSKRHDNEYNLIYNFYLSQLRIRIEMAFDRLTTAWRIFRNDLTYSTEKNSKIARVGCKLHNYVINADNLNLSRYDSDKYVDLEVEPLVDGPRGNRGYLPIVTRASAGNVSSRRNDILRMIEERDIVRPAHTIARNG